MSVFPRPPTQEDIAAAIADLHASYAYRAMTPDQRAHAEYMTTYHTNHSGTTLDPILERIKEEYLLSFEHGYIRASENTITVNWCAIGEYDVNELARRGITVTLDSRRPPMFQGEDPTYDEYTYQVVLGEKALAELQRMAINA